ncbi:hypothetical protein WJX79_008399 [Trebouxia sp. C0005]
MHGVLIIRKHSSSRLIKASEPRRPAGKEQLLIQDDQHWEGKVVEAPFMWKHAGRYYLFYSGNGYNSPEYAVGYAVADHITGPFHKHPQPVLKSDGAVAMLGTNQLPTGTCKFANWQV